MNRWSIVVPDRGLPDITMGLLTRVRGRLGKNMLSSNKPMDTIIHKMMIKKQLGKSKNHFPNTLPTVR
jgi:hypothetical protein